MVTQHESALHTPKSILSGRRLTTLTILPQGGQAPNLCKYSSSPPFVVPSGYCCMEPSIPFISGLQYPLWSAVLHLQLVSRRFPVVLRYSEAFWHVQFSPWQDYLVDHCDPPWHSNRFDSPARAFCRRDDLSCRLHSHGSPSTGSLPVRVAALATRLASHAVYSAIIFLCGRVGLLGISCAYVWACWPLDGHAFMFGAILAGGYQKILSS